ncbi:MAG: PIN domain-containing protein [Coriobacteriia bacterium]|nr:PIN domain-containing protein [Coriobacteriia bacterium]
MRLLLDTTVLIDYFGQREPFYDDCVKLLVMQAVADAELWSSAKSYTDVFYVLRKTMDAGKVQDLFLNSFDRIKPCTIDSTVLREASLRHWDDFEDCLVAVCAERLKADYLITRDVAGFSQAKTPALSPKDFLAMIERDYGVTYDVIDWP